MTRRSFIVFEGVYPTAAEGLQLLGRVVLDPRRPLDNYRPKIEESLLPASDHTTQHSLQNQDSEPENAPQDLAGQETGSRDQSFLSRFHLKPVSDKRTTISAESIKTTTARLNLTNLFSGERTTVSTSNITLRADLFQTFCLEQHGDVYEALIANHEADIEKLFEMQSHVSPGRSLYIMVSLKTAKGLRVLSSDEERRKQALEADLRPVAEAAAVAAGGPPGVVGTALGKVGGALGKKVSRKDALQMVAVEERAIAAEYCEIERTPKAKWSLRRPRGSAAVSKRPTSRFRNEISAFSGDHTSFGAEDEGGAEGESDEDEYR